MTAKKGSSVDSRVKQEDMIQAVIIADSFNSRFAPITHRKPRVKSNRSLTKEFNSLQNQ